MQDSMFDEKQIHPQTKIDQISQKLFDLFSTSKPDLKKIEQLVNSIAKRSNPSSLAVFLASETLWQLPNLAPEILESIQLMKMNFIKKDPILAKLSMRAQVLMDAIDQFCQQKKVDTTYFQLELLKDPNAKQILDFICEQTAANFQSMYQSENWLFQSYTHPGKNIPGVWMSQNNIPYSDNTLLELENAKDKAFQQTYLVPTALTSVKKHVPVQ